MFKALLPVALEGDEAHRAHVILSVDGERYVVALFEGADWVENARAGGWGILARALST